MLFRSKSVGWVDNAFAADIDPLAHKAKEWLIDNVTDEFIDQGGYRAISGRSRPSPPENSLWLLAWTIEALLRIEAEVKSSSYVRETRPCAAE